MFKRERCRAFYDHWDSLRGDRPYPTLSEFLDNPNVACAPCTYIVDIVGNRLNTRFFGTQLVESRGIDLTGKDYVEGQPNNIGDAIVSNVIKLIAHPCGLHAMNIFTSTKGRKFVSEVVVLPLGDDNQSTQATGINDVHNMIGYDETVSGWQGALEIEVVLENRTVV